MAGNTAFLFNYMPIWKRNEVVLTIYCTDREVQIGSMVITIQTSSDDCVRKAGATLPTDRKWAAQGK